MIVCLLLREESVWGRGEHQLTRIKERSHACRRKRHADIKLGNSDIYAKGSEGFHVRLKICGDLPHNEVALQTNSVADI